MFRLLLRWLFVAGVLYLVSLAIPLQAASGAPVLRVEGLGKGVVPLDGPWQFHIGDNRDWALPHVHDDDPSAGWEQINSSRTWGAQTHPGYTGYAWYRKHLSLTPAPGASPDFALLIQEIDDSYEIYWNGVLVGRDGTMPPQPAYPYNPPAQTFGLGPVRDGVLAIRVWKDPLGSADSDALGGLASAPLIGSPDGIAGAKAELDYAWLRSKQYRFGQQLLYGIVMLLSLIGWLRNRSRRALLWIAVFCSASVSILFLTDLHLPFSYRFAIGWLQPVQSLLDIALWFLLLHLLKLDTNQQLTRFTRGLAIVSFISNSLDGLVNASNWTGPFFAPWVVQADAVLTAIYTISEIYPLVLVALALRKPLDVTRWLLAIAAVLAEMISVLRLGLQQGSRFTHWTLGNKLASPLITINGSVLTAQTIANSLLLLTIVYATYRYMREADRRKTVLEQEFKSARELQQVLIPEKLPDVPGFAMTSAYRPALEVGGDFFQIIPLEDAYAGSTLILLGDVSGKGLKAAMAVSMIVGAARALAEFAPGPGAMLTKLNQRLFGRLDGGFVTCLAMRLTADGRCVVASAGHPAPYLNDTEIELPGALPLGILADATYDEEAVELREGDHVALYTDGLLEARRADGTIFSFQRLDQLFATRPDASKATETAINFGQEDDITVLTLTRLAASDLSSTHYSAPQFLEA
jgi:Stage II sporulation protein E (SpoIIE)